MQENQSLRKLQLIEIEVLDEFVRICEKYHLKYYLMFGTLLGAIRHNGFIPWDDDIDVVMPRKDFEFFCRIASKETGKEFVIDYYYTDKNYLDASAKLRMKNTVYATEWHKRFDYISYGCWIDIFPLDNLSNIHSFHYFLQAFINKRIVDKLVHHRMLKRKGGLNIKNRIISTLTKAVPAKFWFKLRNYLCQCDRNEKSRYLSCMLLPYPAKLLVFNRVDFKEATQVKFENKYYDVPCGWEKVLRHLYGDYMRMPPKEQRVYKHEPFEWKL